MSLIKMGKFLAIASAITIGSFGSHAVASTIATWTFETSLPATAGPFAAEVGTGNASGNHAVIATYSTPAGNGSSHSYSSNSWSAGDYYQFTGSAAGLSGLTLTFDATCSNTGPRDFKVQASSGGPYTDIGFSYSLVANATPNPVWNSATGSAIYTITTPLPASLNGQASIGVRLVNVGTVSGNGGVVAGGGTSRVDNVTLAGTAVPEPASAILMVMGCVALVGVGRRFAC
jgi:hypothetical protein